MTTAERGLTDRQAKVLLAIRSHVFEYGYPPSVREIGEAVGLTSTSSVAHQLNVLTSLGWITRDAFRPRCWVVARPLTAVPDEPGPLTLHERWLCDRGECT